MLYVLWHTYSCTHQGIWNKFADGFLKTFLGNLQQYVLHYLSNLLATQFKKMAVFWVVAPYRQVGVYQRSHRHENLKS
jgi:hypothetical protein